MRLPLYNTQFDIGSTTTLRLTRCWYEFPARKMPSIAMYESSTLCQSSELNSLTRQIQEESRSWTTDTSVETLPIPTLKSLCMLFVEGSFCLVPCKCRLACSLPTSVLSGNAWNCHALSIAFIRIDESIHLNTVRKPNTCRLITEYKKQRS